MKTIYILYSIKDNSIWLSEFIGDGKVKMTNGNSDWIITSSDVLKMCINKKFECIGIL